MPGNELQQIENFHQISQLRLDQAETEKRILDRKICQVQQKVISEFQQRLDIVVQLFIIKKSGKIENATLKDVPPEIRKEFECPVCRGK